MGRIYTANVTVAVTAIQDFFQIVGPADGVVAVKRIFIGQSNRVGDAQAEMLRVQISRTDNTLDGSGGTVLTPRPHQAGDPAFGGVVEANNTTQATVTTTVFEEAFNVQAGWYWVPTPEEELFISPSGTIVVELPVAPSASMTMSGSITFEEIGG